MDRDFREIFKSTIKKQFIVFLESYDIPQEYLQLIIDASLTEDNLENHFNEVSTHVSIAFMETLFKLFNSEHYNNYIKALFVANSKIESKILESLKLLDTSTGVMN